MTQTELDTIAPKMYAPARELAHSNAHASGDGAPDAFARGYVLAVAECCGALAADQCADDEAWEPADWLTGDWEAIVDACDLVGLDAGGVAREAWALYREPSLGAYDVQGLARR
jgi:hypothetical protein